MSLLCNGLAGMYKVANDYFSSGLLPIQYEKLFDQMGAGVMSTYMQQELRNNYMTAVDEEVENSCARVLNKELACDVDFEKYHINHRCPTWMAA